MSSGQDPMDGCRFSDKIIFEQESKSAGGSTPWSENWTPVFRKDHAQANR